MNFIKTNKDVKIAEHLVEKPGQQVTHLNLKKGQSTNWHAVDYSVIVIPIAGVTKFEGREDAKEIVPGDIVEMFPGEDHNVTAVEDASLIVVKSHLDEEK